MTLLVISLFTVKQGISQHDDTKEKATLTIVYDISIHKSKNKIGIEETYNGGIKTIMKSGDSYRIRMVSLMRIHNIFLYHPGEKNQEIIMAKESGKDKYQFQLTHAQWYKMNEKYKGARYDFSGKDKKSILGYTCNKATITLNNGQSFTVFYTNALPGLHKSVEPAFEKIPGLVLEYELMSKNSTIKYRASQIETSEIDETVFEKPGKDYKNRKFDVNN